MNNTIRYDILAPCKDCPDRYVGCHSKCEKYLSFRKKLNEHNKKTREELRIQKASYSDDELKANFKNRFKR